MNDPTLTGAIAAVLLLVSNVGNYLLSRRAKNKGTSEAKTYTDEVVKLLQEDLASLQNRLSELVNESYLKDKMIAQAQAERDAARKENEALTTQLVEEHQALIQTANRADELEKRVAVLEQQTAKNDAVKEAAAEIVKLIRDRFTQLVTELAPKPAPVATETNPT